MAAALVARMTMTHYMLQAKIEKVMMLKEHWMFEKGVVAVLVVIVHYIL